VPRLRAKRRESRALAAMASAASFRVAWQRRLVVAWLEGAPASGSCAARKAAASVAEAADNKNSAACQGAAESATLVS
jgi:hypothetical protein